MSEDFIYKFEKCDPTGKLNEFLLYSGIHDAFQGIRLVVRDLRETSLMGKVLELLYKRDCKNRTIIIHISHGTQ